MSPTLAGEAGRGEKFSWCLFDFANSAFNTIIITFMYSAFFAKVLVGDEGQGDLLWSSSLTFVGVFVAILSPLLGVYADRGNTRRVFLIGFSLLTILCTALLAIPAVPEGAEHASSETIWLALILVSIANISFELAFVFYNSYLPGLVGNEKVGSLSGKGWASGYL
ncbi:MAG: MFS transporter, partial [Planctomycetota bacterium]